MHLRNTATRYGFVAASLHWVIVAGIIAQYLLAEAFEDGPREDSAMGVHNALGMTLLALALVRVVWRLLERPPAPPPTMKRYEILVARSVHALFYVLLFAIPISGWALATVDGNAISFFGLFDIPQLSIAGAPGEDRLEDIHELLFNVLVGIALLHVIAALKHHFFDRDDVLRSMFPGGR